MNVKRLCGFALALLLAFRCMALPAAASGRFADVPADSVYGESVAYLVEHGITRGASLLLSGAACYSKRMGGSAVQSVGRKRPGQLPVG